MKNAIGIDIVQFNALALSEKNTFISRTGAHEIGHVLGLNDIDDVENSNYNYYHHEELLMGYSKSNIFNNKQTEITYKDITGVLVALGYHTPDEHIWLCDSVEYEQGYKLICAICNGVKYVDDINGVCYYPYKYCNNYHLLSFGNMMPVARYNNFDYYKCMYCRHVAPYTEIVEQNYTYCYYNNRFHQCLNNVDGFEYVLYESHEIMNGVCTKCNE